MTATMRIDTGRAPTVKALAFTGLTPSRRIAPIIRILDVDMGNKAEADTYEGYSKEQFENALRLASPVIAEKAQAAEARGRVGKDEARRRMREALDAGA